MIEHCNAPLSGRERMELLVYGRALSASERLARREAYLAEQLREARRALARINRAAA